MIVRIIRTNLIDTTNQDACCRDSSANIPDWSRPVYSSGSGKANEGPRTHSADRWTFTGSRWLRLSFSTLSNVLVDRRFCEKIVQTIWIRKRGGHAGNICRQIPLTPLEPDGVSGAELEPPPRYC